MPDESAAEARFDREDIAAIVEHELPLALERTFPDGIPQAILLAGQPGAGKTELSTMMVSMLDRNAIFINGDDYRRHHPNYRTLYARYGFDVVSMTSAFSSAITEQMIDRISDQRRNLVIEGTGRTVDVPRSTAQMLSAKGYNVQMAVIAARPEVSLTSTLLRFCRMNENGTIPRATAIAAHDAVVSALPGNLDVLLALPCISRIRIWDRSLRVLFDSSAGGSAKPSAALLGYWHSKWDANELDEIRRQLDLLHSNDQLAALGQASVLVELTKRVEDASRLKC